MRPVLLILALVAGFGLSEPVILLQTDFSQLPQGWVSDEDWAFGSFGAALCVSVQDTVWSGEFSTEGEPPVRYAVPQGTDSVVVSVNHWVFLSSGDVISDASSSAMIQLWTSQSGWGDYLYHRSAADTLFSEETTSTLVLDDIPPDTFLGFRFVGDLVSEHQGNYAEIIWQIEDLTVTAYGTGLGLDTGTWGGIKASF